MKRPVSVAAGVLAASLAVFAQGSDHPVFAGDWRFDQAATIENANAAKMIGGPIFGDRFAAEQTATSLTLWIATGSLRLRATYALDGSVSKNESPALAPGESPIEVSSRAKWDGDRLVITSNSRSPGPDGPVEVDSIRTLWLDARGRLVIERTGTPVEIVPSSRSVYSKR